MNPLRAFHNIVSDQALQYEQKLELLIKFGLELFNLEIGIISRITGSDYEVLYAVSDIEELKPGLHFELNETYCVHTMAASKATGFHHAGKSLIADHPCYQTQQLEAYLGAPIKVGNETFGTINFSSSEPSRPFTEEDFDYVELIAQWLGTEILREDVFQKLNSQAARLKKLEKVGNIGTWSVDLITQEIYWSEETRRIHQVDNYYVPEMVSAIHFYKEGKSRDNINRAVQNVLDTGTSWNMNTQIVTAKGIERWVNTRGEVDYQKGKPVRLFGTFQDVTEQVEASDRLKLAKDSAENASLVKSQFLANMSHEIRTPMNGIMGTLQILEQSEVNSKYKSLIAKAIFSTSNLLTIINDILDYSKIEANALKLESVPFSMLQIMDSIQSDFEIEAENKGIAFNVDIDLDYQDGWMGDPVRVRQILLNLMSNAIKFTKKGQVRIRQSNRVMNGLRSCNFEITDTGVGMSKDTIERVFERFEQADSSTTRHYGGTGLGMAICKSLVSMMEGNLEIRSEIGKGTCISVNLPLSPTELIKSAFVKESLVIPNFDNKRILLAEDNQINQEILLAMLEPTSADVYVVENGALAVSAFKQATFDLVLMDIQMPEVDGVSAFKQIAALKTNIPVVALTANVMADDIKNYKAIGFAAHVGKPVDMKTFYNTMSKLI